MPEVNFVTQIKGDKQVVTSLEQIDKAIDAIGRDGQIAAKKTDDAFRSMGTGITSSLASAKQAFMGFVGAIAATQIVDLISGIGRASIDMAMDAVESENLFAVSMGEMANKAVDWSKKFSDSMGLNEYALRKQIGTFNVMFGSMGLGAEKAYDLSKGLTELAYDMASFYNLKPEEAFDKLRAGITGEAEPLKRLGILIDENTTKTYAYTIGIAKTGAELSQNEKVLARYAAIMGQTSDAQGDMARTAESPANQLRRLNSTVEELQTNFGMAFLPVISAVSGELGGLADSATATNSGLQHMAKVIALPLAMYIEIGRTIAELKLSYVELGQTLYDKLGSKLGFLAVGVSVQQLAKDQRDAAASVLEWQEKADKLSKSIADLGNFNYDAAKKAQAFAGANRDAAESAEQIQKQLKKLKDSHAFDFWESAQDVMALTADSIERINLALRPNAEMEQYFAQINSGLDGAITRLATIEAEASRIDPDKLMADIAKSTMEMTEVSAEILSEDFERQQELIRETEREYKEMIKGVRDGAGEVFDAIVSRGEDAFTNLGDWIEATFLSRLRKLFQNFIEWMSNGFKGGFEQVLAGVIPSLGGMGGDSAFAELQQIMGGGEGETYGRQSGIFGLSGSLGSLVQSGLMMGGSWAFMDSFKQKGARGWLESIGGGAALGASIGSVIPGIGTAIGAAVGAAVGAISKGIQSIAKAITGPNSYEATSKEISRDFGGIGVSDKEVQSWMSSVGLKENQVWDIRQNMKTSPSFLYEVAWAAAEAQGKTDEFLKSLEKVGTSWGEFNFRTAFEIGRLTGDWSKLNEMWMETSNLGDAFKDMPAVLDNLLLGDGTLPEYEQLVKDLYELQAAIQGTLPATLDMYDTFLQTGEITEEFAAKIKELGGNIEEWRAASATITGNTAQIASLLAVSTALAGLKNSIAATTAGVGTMYEKFLETGEISEELASQITDLGGDLAAFQSMSRLQAISSEYAQLVEHFRESGEILPRLSELFAEFGGNVSALSMDSFDLSGLTDRLSFVQSLVSQLKSSLPDPIATLLSGKMDADVIASLTGAGLDPSAFGNLMSVIGKRNQFSASNFQAFQEMNPELEYYLKQYGGSAGATALSRYGMGQNTITSGLLNDVQMNIEKEYQDEVKKLLEYLGTVEGETQSEIDRLTQVMDDQLTALEDQFATVGGNIEKALNDSKVGVMSEIDLMIGSIQTQTQTLSDAINDAKEGIVSAIDSLISGAITQGASGSAQSNNSVTVQIDMSGSYVANSAAFYQDMAAAMETYFKNGGSLEMLGAR